MSPNNGDPEEKIVLNREAYPSNSNKSKQTAPQVNRPRKTQVATARKVKKPILKRFAEAFGGEGNSGNDVFDYIMYDVVIPAAKSTFADLVEGAIDMVLFGGGNARTQNYTHRSRGRSYVSYSDMYSGSGGQSRQRSQGRPDARRPYNVEPAHVNKHDFTSIVLGSRAEAEAVLSEMVEMVVEYGVVSVSDFYDLTGMPIDYTDNKYGWFDLRNISTVRVRDGWTIDLPRPNLIE